MVEVSTDKVDAEVPAPASGTITKVFKQPDDTVKVGEALAEISASGARGRAATPASDGERRPRPQRPRRRRRGRPSSLTRRAPHRRRRAASTSEGQGSGAAAGSRRPTCSPPPTAATAPAPRAPAAEGEAKPLRGPAAMLAKAMDESRSIPTATSFRTLAVDTLDAKRKALNGVLKERGMKVSFTHLVAWAIVQAAKEWRVMARSFSEQDGKPQPSSPATSTSGSPSTSSARTARAA